MKKFLVVLLSAMMIMTLVACGGSKFKAGTYTGTGKGFASDITVELTIDESKTVTACNVVSSNESPDIGEKALPILAAEVVAKNTAEPDTVSSATRTSTGFKEAVANALKEAGLTASDLKAKEGGDATVTDETLDADIVIIGAGGAGMTAAITAAQAGKSVVIVEKAAFVGGNSSKSTGGMNAAKTEWQDLNTFGEDAGIEKQLTAAEKYPDLAELAATVKAEYEAYKKSGSGYFDSVNLFILDTMIGGKGINNIDLVTTLAKNSEDAIAWLGSLSTPVVMHNVSSFGGASVKRIHRPVNDEGKTVSCGSYMIPLLEKNCESLGIKILCSTTATEIVMSNGAAVGIKANSATVNYTINAKAVIDAAGGFGANMEMVVENKPDLAGFASTNAPTITGDGIKMATAVGAGTVDMNQIQIHPTVYVAEDGSTALITEGLRGDGAILVNQEGKRFIDEVGTRDVVSAAELAQTGSYAYLIVDQAMVDASSVIAGYIKKGYTVSGEDAAALAAALDIDAATLTETMNTWNSYVEAKNDPDFNRTSFANQLTGALYAIKITPAVHHTMGGITINTNAEVLATDGSVIPGLFAAGEVTGGVHGANRLGGNAVADFVVFGRIAGASAVEYAK